LLSRRCALRSNSTAALQRASEATRDSRRGQNAKRETDTAGRAAKADHTQARPPAGGIGVRSRRPANGNFNLEPRALVLSRHDHDHTSAHGGGGPAVLHSKAPAAAGDLDSRERRRASQRQASESEEELAS